MSGPLQQIGDWPVLQAAAIVVGPAGVLAEAGPTAEQFPLASVTKPLTALAALVAVEEGALELDEPIADRFALPAGLAAELPGISLRHLLAHASGLAPDRLARAAAPGKRRIYSNTGYDLVGEVISQATGIAFASYLAEAVFAPLRMSSATLAGSPARDGIASAGDIAAVVSELLTPSGWLHPDTLAAARSVQFPGLGGVLPGYGSQSDNAWGLGFEIRASKQPHWTSSRNSPGTYGHFGQSGTMFWLDPVAELGLIALADEPFGDWARQAWPALAAAVLDAFG